MTPRDTTAPTRIPDPHIENLAQLESGYWWYVGRIRWAAALVESWARGRDLRSAAYADIGCGTGGFATEMKRKFQFSAGLLVDSHPAVLQRLKGISGFTVLQQDLAREMDLPWKPTVATCMDVMEHLPDDHRFLAEMRRQISDDGLLVLSVPAHPWLFSDWDRLLGHYRRYTRRELAAKFRHAGFQVERLHYTWSFLVPPALARKFRRAGDTSLEFPKVPPWLNETLKLLSDGERKLSPYLSSPWGTSLIVSATPIK